jgi:hypothetical protein
MKIVYGKSLVEANWIAKAVQNPGALRKGMKVPAGKNIPTGKLEKVAKKNTLMGKRARLALTLKSFQKG